MSAGPRGRLSRGALEDSRFYPRTRRDYWVYTPPGHEADVPAALMVFQDREAYVADDGWFRVPRVFDRLIAEGRMPPHRRGVRQRRQTARRPLRVFLQSGANDVDNEMGHWLLCNQQMEAALRFRGYEVRGAWGEGGHDGVHGGAILAESLEWLWRPQKAHEGGHP